MNGRRSVLNFLKRWHAAFDRIQNRRQRATPDFDLWEGELACKELERNGVLHTVQLGNKSGDRYPKAKDWRFRMAICKIAEEIGHYLKYANKVVERNRGFQQADEFIERMISWFKKEKKRTKLPEVEQLYRQYITQLEANRKKVQHWNIQNREREYLIWERPSGVWGRLKINHLYQNKRPRRESDLDTLFQIRLALILRQFLQEMDGISLQTIARLIVLTYLSADLATDQDGDTIVKHTGKKLTVPNVVQRLARAGIK